MSDIKHIVVATDGSEGSMAAASHAGVIARALGARVTILFVLSDEMVMPHAWGPSSFPDTAPFGSMNVEEIRQMLEARVTANELPRTAAKLGNLDTEPNLVVSWGHPAQEVCRYADDEGADMIIVGSHGRSALGRAFLGSVSHGVANHAKCPVTIVR